MIGIRFKIKNEYDNIFYKIFRGIDFENYRWDIVEDEIYSLSGENYFDQASYSNEEFKKLIEDGIYYPVFATIQIYRIQDEVGDIQTYEDFIRSKCQLILFITDNEFVDIYAKNEAWLNVIYRNTKDNNFENIQYIEDNKSHIRHRFSAYSD